MPSKPRTLFAILFGVPILLFIPVWVIGSSVYQAGTIEFSVHEKGPNGCQISGSIPAAVVSAIHLAPHSALDEIRHEMHCEIGDATKIVEAALNELSRCPDGVLVDVRTDTEVVTIEKRNGSIRVDVDTPGEKVQASVPLSAMRSFISAI
jgi:hypothetical protein